MYMKTVTHLSEDMSEDSGLPLDMLEDIGLPVDVSEDSDFAYRYA